MKKTEPSMFYPHPNMWFILCTWFCQCPVYMFLPYSRADSFQHMYFLPKYLPWLVVSFCHLLCKLVLPHNQHLSKLNSLTDGSWYNTTLAPYSPDELWSTCFILASRFLPAGWSSSNQHCKLAWKWMLYWVTSFLSLTF